jgi:hypothetical protein
MPSKKEKAEALRGEKQKVRVGTHTRYILCHNYPRTDSFFMRRLVLIQDPAGGKGQKKGGANKGDTKTKKGGKKEKEEK